MRLKRLLRMWNRGEPVDLAPVNHERPFTRADCDYDTYHAGTIPPHNHEGHAAGEGEG